MIVTHTQNIHGQCRIYLGGKGSLECWIEPADDRKAWSFHLDDAVIGNRLSEDDRRAWAIHTLLQLALELSVPPAELKQVPFDMIAALHSADPYFGRRVAVPRRQVLEHGFMATAPNISRPRADFQEPRARDSERH